MKVALERLVPHMLDIRHLLREIADIQTKICCLEPGSGEREKLTLEWREIAQTLEAKMEAAKYFQCSEHLYVKYLNVQTIEVVQAVTGRVQFADFGGVFQDLLQRAEIISETTYGFAVEEALQKGGQDNG